MFQTKVVEKIKTHISYSVTFLLFWKSCGLWDNLEKHHTAGHAYRMLDSQGYKLTHWICNTYCCPLLQWLHERTSILH